MTGDDLAAWTLSLAWAEHQCCMSVGRWSVAATVDGVTAALGPVSAHHGWRAEQWRELWPARRGGLDGAAADPPPPAGADDPLGGLIGEVLAADRALGPTDGERWDEPTSVAALGVAAQMILPRLMVGYRTLVRLADGPAGVVVRRNAERSLGDATSDFLAVSGKLGALGCSPTATATLSAWVEPQ